MLQVRQISLLAIATFGIGIALTPAAQAREYTVTGSNGRSTQTSVTRQPIPNGTSVQRSTTLPNGKTTSVAGSTVRTGDGSYNRNVVLTGPNGKQTTVNGTGIYQNGVLNGSRTVTNPNGQSRTTTLQSNP